MDGSLLLGDYSWAYRSHPARYSDLRNFIDHHLEGFYVMVYKN